MIGYIDAIYRYPVKSMRGERLESASLGWHGLDGDRRFALRRTGARSDFPWLSASQLPGLVRFTPVRREDNADSDLPTHVRTPDGVELPICSDELATEIGHLHNAPVEMMQMKHGVFDDATISVLATDTADEITRLAGQPSDIRRFRPNIVVRLIRAGAFQEDDWIGGTLSFGDGDDAPAVSVTTRDIRCSMVNIEPDAATIAPDVMKAVVRANQNNAGVYCTVTRIGRLDVGQKIFLR